MKTSELGIAEFTLDAYTKAIDYNSDGNVIYYGRAAIGSIKSDPVWQIVKYVYSGLLVTDIQWADGNNLFDNVWDDRADIAIPYS